MYKRTRQIFLLRILRRRSMAGGRNRTTRKSGVTICF